MYQPDQIDWKIVALLNQDGRLSSAEIARMLGNVSARTVTNRIDTLTKHGIINVRAIVNAESVGYAVLADVFIEVQPGKLREVADILSEMPQVTYLACATGNTDIISCVRAPNINELYEFVIEKIGKIPGVRHTETYLMPLNLKSNETWLPPQALDDGEVNTDQDI